jgi:hypothetical protein
MRDYANITDLGFEFVDGIENPSGLSEEAYLIRVSDIATEAVPSEVGTTAASIVTITGDHILKAAKAPIPVNILYGKSGSEFKLAGEELSKIFEHDTTFFVPQISAAVLGGAAAMKNSRFIILVKRPGQGIGFWQIGTKGMSAKPQDMSGGFATGPTGEVGIKLILKAFNLVPMYDYQGELPAPAGA